MRKPSALIRLLLAAIVAGAGIAGVLAWRSGERNSTNPKDCLRRYYDALQAGDIDAFSRCLAEPLRTKARTEFADPAHLRRQSVKSWTCVAADEPGGRETRLDVDEVRESSVRRMRFRLEQTGGTWLIATITPLEEKPSSIPYGKDIRDP